MSFSIYRTTAALVVVLLSFGLQHSLADWRPVKLGAGGFITGYDVSDDGTTRIVRTDTYGDYRWDQASDKWVQMLTAESMGANIAVPGAGSYVYESLVAPGTPTRLYRWYRGKIYRSDDRGAHWSATSYPTAYDVLEHGGLAYTARVFGKNMAVDPANADVVLSGSYLNGIHLTLNGGTNWIDLSASIPKSSFNGYRINGNFLAGATSISVSAGIAGIPQNSTIYFDNNTSSPHVVTSGLTSGSGTITVTPPLKASVASGTYLLSPGGYSIAFDRSSPVVGGRTQRIYAASYGNGVYRSIDGGVSWSPIGGPASFKHLRVATDGSVYVLDNSVESIVQRFSAGVWTNISPGGQWNALAIDPQNPARIVLNEAGSLGTSLDRGRSWVKTAWASWLPNCTEGYGGQKRSATDIPWLQWAKECYMSAADIRFEPSGTPSRLWFAQGIGVWYYDFVSTSAPSDQITWISQSRGIEQLVTNWIVSPPGGSPTIFAWDRPSFFVSNPDLYPSTYGPNAQAQINMGWSGDYASSMPATLVGIFNWYGPTEHSGLSTDGGRTWSKFASAPNNVLTGGLGGGIAASTPTNILWCPNNNRAPSYTLDGGRSWTTLTRQQIPNLPSDGVENGFGFAYYTNHQTCAADRVKPNQFYMYNYLTSPSIQGIYRTRDGGRTWVRIYDRIFTPGASPAQAKLRTVPGRAGHMFFAYGTQGSDPLLNMGGFFRSVDGDLAEAGRQVWQPISNVGGVLAFGFGANAPGIDYPTVFIAGWVNNTYGIWKAEASAAQWSTGSVSWVNLTSGSGGFPLQIFDTVKAVEGDANTYGKVYVGFQGSGAVYYQNETAPEHSSEIPAPVAQDPPASGGTNVEGNKGKGRKQR